MPKPVFDDFRGINERPLMQLTNFVFWEQNTKFATLISHLNVFCSNWSPIIEELSRFYEQYCYIINFSFVKHKTISSQFGKQKYHQLHCTMSSKQ